MAFKHFLEFLNCTKLYLISAVEQLDISHQATENQHELFDNERLDTEKDS